MSQGSTMTMEELVQDMACLRKVFSIVRLVSEEGETFEDGAALPAGVCHCDPKETEGLCQYCQKQLHGRGFPEGGVGLDFKIIDSDIYQVFTKPVTISGKTYLMEMLKKLTEEEMQRSENYTKLLSYNRELYIDALTGAYNRRFYEDRMKNLTGNAGVALIDLDNLKICNDSFGHAAGDAALKTVVDTVKGLIRSSDKMIRYGGDEFLLIMPDVTPVIFSKKLHQIQEKVRDALFPKEEGMHITVSIGGAMLYDGNIEEVIAHADQLMYYAKAYKNSVALEDDIDFQEIPPEIFEKKPYVLIIDDSVMNRDLLREMLQDKYRVLEAEDGEKGLYLLAQYGTQITLVLLDIVMPGIDGFGVLESMKKDGWLQDIPVIMISSEDSADAIERAYTLGASDYVSRPFTMNVVRQRAANIIRLYARQQYMLHSMINQRHEKERNNKIMIAILSEVVGFVNGESRAHVLHVSKLSEMLIEQLVAYHTYNISEKEQYLISTSAALHDIGKIAIDSKILNKPGRLTKEEFDAMKAHTVIGAEMIKNLDQFQDEPLVQVAYEICRWHHERWDGRGYPDGLKGDEIPISAQVVSLADVYDALTSKRVYKDAFSHEKALQMILNGECGTFNPLLLRCLTDIEERLQDELAAHNERLTKEMEKRK